MEISQYEQKVTPKVTIVLPTLNEASSLEPLVSRIHQVASEKAMSWEALIVDDGSDDGTREVAESLSRRCPVRLLVRNGRRGLASAILEGIQAACSDLVVVMDGDGSHPPESIPRLLEPLLRGEAELVVGSRYVEGGELKGWSLTRMLASKWATCLARTVGPIRDPLAGFFALRKSCIPLGDIRPRGFKLLLEILARHPEIRVEEVPIRFGPRWQGKSKMGIHTMMEFLLQMGILLTARSLENQREFVRFCAVGLVGMGLDFLAFWFLIHAFYLAPLLAQAGSFWIASTHNFLWNRYYTFKHGRFPSPGVSYVRFLLVAVISFSFRTAAMMYLMQKVGFGPLAALVGGILTAVILNFVGSKLWAFNARIQEPTLLVPIREGTVWGCIGVLLVWRFLYAGVLQLIPEEAYYWNYAMHPSMGYFDHPPMVAWVIRAGTLIAGSGELGVRLWFLLLGLGSSWLLYRLGAIWFDRRVGLGAALAFHLLPLPFGFSMLAMPDGPLFFFWLLTAYGVSLALLRGGGSWWLLAGGALGFALLSKYNAILLLPSVALLLARDEGCRRWLLRPEPYLGLLIAAMLFSPVIWWNANHDWASFRFQFVSRLSHHGYHPLLNLLRFAGSQMAIQTPFVFAGMVLALIVALKRERAFSSRGWRFSWAFSLPCLGAFAVYGLQSWVKVNWAAPAYLTLIPAGVALYLRRRSTSTSRFFAVVTAGVRGTPYAALFFVSMAFYHLTVGIPGFPAPTRAVAWRQLAEQASQRKAYLKGTYGQDPFLLGLDKYPIASELAFYTHTPRDTYSQDAVGADGLGYAYWSDHASIAGRNAVAVLEARKRSKIRRLRTHFEKVGIPQTIEVSWAGRGIISYLVIPCMGYSLHPIRHKRSRKLGH